MSEFKKVDGCIEFIYGYDEKLKQYYYKVFDINRKQINNGLIEEGGTRTTGLTPIILAEKMKKFDAPKQHIQRVLYMRKI